MEDQGGLRVKGLYSTWASSQLAECLESKEECSALTRQTKPLMAAMKWQRLDELHTRCATCLLCSFCAAAKCVRYKPIMTEQTVMIRRRRVWEFQWCLCASKQSEQQSKLPPQSSLLTTISLDDDSLNKTLGLYIFHYPTVADNSTLDPQTNQ